MRGSAWTLTSSDVATVPGGNLVVVLAVLWAVLVFSGWSLLQWLFGTLAAVGLSSDPFYVFSDQTSWLPLASEVARGNLFPSQPSLGTGASGLRFYPYLSLWAQGLLIAVFGLKGSLIIGETLFPSTAFLLVVLIYRHYLPPRWATALAAVGLVAFTSMPLREFLVLLALGQGWREIGTVQPPDVAHFPIPSFTLVAFLIAFYWTIQRQQPTAWRLVLLTIVWSLQVYVHIANALIGLPIWFVALTLRLWRRGWRGGRLARSVAVQSGLAAVICLPAAWSYATLVRDGLSFLGLRSEVPAQLFGPYFYFAYFVGPLALQALVFLVRRVDTYELFVKFWPIYLSMLVEFSLVAAKVFTGIGVPPELIFLRLGVFFLHMFYYVPPLYYLTQPAPAYHAGAESSSVGVKTREALEWAVGEASRVYIPLLFVLLSFYVAASANRAFEHAKAVRAPRLQASIEDLNLLASGAEWGEVLVADEPPVNLMVPLAGRFGALWVNRFSNEISESDQLERLALWARLVGWSEDRFVRLMRPSSAWGRTAGDLVDSGRGADAAGVGYWLVWHRTEAGAIGEEAQFETRVREVYRDLDVREAVKRFGVTRVLSSVPLPAGVRVAASSETPRGRLYLLAR